MSPYNRERATHIAGSSYVAQMIPYNRERAMHTASGLYVVQISIQPTPTSDPAGCTNELARVP